jgi:diguanylate cyclase (GGDEF)-like protein
MIAEVITEQIKHEQKIIHMMNHDMLTGMPNRKYFQEMLNSLLEKNDKKNYTLLVTSFDNVSDINNYYNIFTGDKFIQEASKRLAHCLNNNASLARFEGGKFACILNYANKEKVNKTIKSMHTEVSHPFLVESYTIKSSVTIGVCIFNVADTNYEKLIKDSEIALMEAKHSATQNTIFFDADLERKYLRRLLLENNIQRSLNTSQFYVVYQPLYSFQEDKVIGAEALLRWRHPQLKEISPVEFIPIFEKTGKITQIGYSIFDEFFSTIKQK